MIKQTYEDFMEFLLQLCKMLDKMCEMCYAERSYADSLINQTNRVELVRLIRLWGGVMELNFYGLGSFIKTYDFKDKQNALRSYITYMLNRTMKMFEYDNLPDTIPKRMLELYIMINGHSVVVKYNDNLYVCFGGWGGEPNEYYIPTKYIVANPYLKLFKDYTIGEDCTLVYNDSMYYGLMPLFRRYATNLVENDLTMNIVDINSRITALIEAMDDSTRASALKYLQDIEDGKRGVIASTAFFDGIRAQPYGEHNYQRLTDLIEFEQYVKASWFNELGLNANYNMKRESITSSESQLNDDMLPPLVDDMFDCRREFCTNINNMFGTNISVRWGSAWADNREELELEHKIMEKEVEEVDDGQSIVSDSKTDDE